MFLEIEVREDTGPDCADGTGHTVLAPRQELTATPYAAYALAAENSSFLNGRAASFYSNAQNLQGILPSRNLEGTYSESVIFDHPANVFVGNGTGLYYLMPQTSLRACSPRRECPSTGRRAGTWSGTIPTR